MSLALLLVSASAMPALEARTRDTVSTVETETVVGPPVSVSTVTTTVNTETGVAAVTASVDGKTNVDIREGSTATVEEPRITTTTTTTTEVANVMSPGREPCADKKAYEGSQANAENLTIKQPINAVTDKAPAPPVEDIIPALVQTSGPSLPGDSKAPPKVDPNNQSGSDEFKDPSTQITTLNPTPSQKVEDAPLVQRDLDFNTANESYPIGEKDSGKPATKESSEAVAGVSIVDPSGNDIHGVSDEALTLDRPDVLHPMEELTPLIDNFPCDPDNVLQVSVPDVIDGILPLAYGCSDWDEIAREKASPEVTWTNVATDVVDFSLQMVDIGGEECDMRGDTVGKIHWHVENITKAMSVTMQKGASHDLRMLNGGVEMTNSWLETYYGGPCPPRGHTGCYRFKVLAHRLNGVCQCGHADVKFVRPDKPPAEWLYNKKNIAPVGVAEIEDPAEGWIDPADVKPDPMWKPGASIGLSEGDFGSMYGPPANLTMIRELFAILDSFPEATLKVYFQQTDVNKDARVSTGELKVIMAKLLPQLKATDQDLQAAIGMVDTDGDNQVSFDELKAVLKVGLPVPVKAVKEAPRPVAEEENIEKKNETTVVEKEVKENKKK